MATSSWLLPDTPRLEACLAAACAAPRVAGRFSDRAAVEADAGLRVEHGAARGELDRERDDRHQRRGDHEAECRHGDIERAARAFDRLATHRDGGKPVSEADARHRVQPNAGGVPK